MADTAGNWQSGAMLIKGYEYGPLVPGEGLLDRPGFWANHLLGLCSFDSDGPRPAPEWFGDDGADTDAMSEALMDDQQWPVFRIPFDGSHSILVVYRNLVGDYGVDYLLNHPDWTRSKALASFDGDWSGPGLSWRDLVQISDTPDSDTIGIHDPASRLLLLLPVLRADKLPSGATARVGTALSAVGVPRGTALDVAERLLEGRRPTSARTDTSGSPLSSVGPHRLDAEASASMILRSLHITRPQNDLLARALGSPPTE
jgi:hypothetical protein